MKQLVPFVHVENRIHTVRGVKVMLDRDLADLYGVSTKHLNQAVTRNLERFPIDFMFTLRQEEYERIRGQDAEQQSISGGIRYLPRAFTEEGVAMLSGVIRSKQAVEVNILIMRAFVKMREIMLEYRELTKKLDEMEKKYDAEFRIVFQAIRELMTPPAPAEKKRFGFQKPGDDNGDTKARRKQKITA